jgi:hypothetical protein
MASWKSPNFGSAPSMKCASARRACPRSVANQKGRSVPKLSPKRASTRVQHLLDRFVGGELHRPAEIHLVRGRLAVVVVVVPLAALGLVAVHQEAGLAPHLAVEPLHPQFLAPLGPGLELGVRTQEPVIGELVDGDRAVLERGDQAKLSGFGRQHLVAPVAHRRAQKSPGMEPALSGSSSRV